MPKVNLNFPPIDFTKLGAHMPRERHQRGYVRLTGKTEKKWRGFFHVYVVDENGQEHRRGTSVILGRKADLKKWEAEEKLQGIIQKETKGKPARPDPDQTFGYFWKHRYLPMKESSWRTSTRTVNRYIIEKHVLPVFGECRLKDIGKFEIQMFLNDLAKSYSKSIIHKSYVYLKASLEEAVDQEFIDRNPMRKVVIPKTKKESERFLSLAEIKIIDLALADRLRDRLIFHLFIIVGFRPGELFALRINDVFPGALRVDEAVYRNRLGAPKTEESAALVPIPLQIERELEEHLKTVRDKSQNGFLFEARYRGRPIDPRSYLRRFLKPLADEAGVPGITFQAFRRSFATHFQKHGAPKEAQEILRHSDISTTLNIYTKLIPESARQSLGSMYSQFFGDAVATGSERVN